MQFSFELRLPIFRTLKRDMGSNPASYTFKVTKVALDRSSDEVQLTESSSCFLLRTETGIEVVESLGLHSHTFDPELTGPVFDYSLISKWQTPIVASKPTVVRPFEDSSCG